MVIVKQFSMVYVSEFCCTIIRNKLSTKLYKTHREIIMHTNTKIICC